MIRVVVFKPHQQPIQLMFRRAETAEAAYRLLVANGRGGDDFEFEVSDDFGSTAMINRDDATILMQDLEKAQEAEGEIALIGARQQAKTQRAAQNDPQLKFLAPNGVMGAVNHPGFRAG